jgi:ribonuclease G
MTRQNVTDGPREVMTKKCPTCGGDGIVVSEQTAAVDVERRLRSLPTPGSRSKAFKVELNARVASLVAGPAAERLLELEETTKRRFFLVGKEDVHLDHFRVLEQGTLEKVAPQVPVEVGQELDLKLGELGLHDSHAGVGKVDGLDVVVAGTAKLVGKKVTARIAAVTEGVAWAELLAPVEVAEPPLTAEAEAEKPTRARRPATRKKAEEEPAVDEQAEVEADAAEAEDADAETELDEDGAPKKKRTRRGSRGGRNRRKKPATEAEATADGASAAAVATLETDGGEIEADAEPEVEAEAEVEAEPEAQEDASGNGGGDWGYTPMSDWGLDEDE